MYFSETLKEFLCIFRDDTVNAELIPCPLNKTDERGTGEPVWLCKHLTDDHCKAKPAPEIEKWGETQIRTMCIILFPSKVRLVKGH